MYGIKMASQVKKVGNHYFNVTSGKHICSGKKTEGGFDIWPLALTYLQCNDSPGDCVISLEHSILLHSVSIVQQHSNETEYQTKQP